MGQKSHAKYKEFKQAEREAKKYGGRYIEKARIKELEYELQDREDNASEERMHKFFDDYGF